MKISVAVTTYNGEQFIIEQLTSIINQSRQPDEVIICDDCSKDDTVNLITCFINENKLESSWKIVSNGENKGFTKNFIDCARSTTGELVFFCDQDDIWLKNKIATIERFILDNDNIMAISHKFNVIDENGKIIDSIYNKYMLGNGLFEQVSFAKQVRNNHSTGCTLAVKRKALDYIFPIIIEKHLTYDVPIGILLAAENRYYIYNKSLMLRRLHTKNVSEPKFTLASRLDNVDSHIKGIQIKENMLRQLLSNLVGKISNDDLKHLNQIIDMLSSSIFNLKHRKTILLIRSMFSRNPMQNRLASFVNLLCVICKK